MQTLTVPQSESVSGGILWSTPALVAIADSGALGPLAFSFGLGYGIGTWLYQNVISE